MTEVSIIVAAGVAGLLLFPAYMGKSLEMLGFRKHQRVRATIRKRDISRKSLK